MNINHVRSIDYSNFSSYRCWVDKLHSVISTNNHGFGLISQKYLLDLVLRPSVVYSFFLDNSNYFSYTWANGELKGILEPYALVSDEDLYWANQYPFLSQNISDYSPLNPSTLSVTCYNISDKFVDLPSTVDTYNESYGIVVSHVNHFGHFILDDLPLQIWFKLAFPEIKTYGISFENQHKGISTESLLVSNLLPPNLFPYRGVVFPANRRICVDQSISFAVSNPIIRFYLMSKFRKFLLNLPSESNNAKINSSELDHFKGKKIFVTRAGSSQTRISNHSDVIKLFRTYNFIILDISVFNLLDISILFSESVLIAAECGTATHLSAILSPSRTQILAFVPETLLQITDNSALYGCLSYYAGYLDRVTFIPGVTVSPGDSITSDIVSYDLRYLNSVLSNLCCKA